MFELSIALKYLLPRKRQLSRSIISLISVGVISLVVWLILVFFSVTSGLERIWVDKMIALTAPVRVVPTEKYYSSYYHQVDSHAESSGFTTKSLFEKWNRPSTELYRDAYDKESDPELPVGFPSPDLNDTQDVKDLVALLKKSTDSLEEVSASPYAMAPANLRLTLIRPQGPLMLTQAVYVGSFDGEDSHWDRFFEKLPSSPFTVKRAPKNGAWHLPSTPQMGSGILLPKNFSESGVQIGDRGSLSYFSPGASTIHEMQKDIFIAGFYDPGIIPIGGRFVLVSPSLADQLKNDLAPMERSLSEGINLKFPRRGLASEIKERLLSLLDENGIPGYFDVLTYEEFDFTKDLIQQLKSEKNIFSLLALIIILVACSNIISMLIILVNDKKKEIAILRAMGATSWSISLIFGITGAITGMMGTLIGFILATLTLHNFDAVIAILTRVQGFQPFNPLFFGNELPHSLSFEASFFVFLSTFLLSVVSALIPAIKASRLHPAHVLRAE